MVLVAALASDAVNVGGGCTGGGGGGGGSGGGVGRAVGDAQTLDEVLVGGDDEHVFGRRLVVDAGGGGGGGGSGGVGREGRRRRLRRHSVVAIGAD